MRILLVEDEKALCRAVRDTLAAAGYTVDCCGTGPDALDALCAGSYDLVLLDRMLPGMDGLSVLRQARQAGVRTPVLMLTALDAVGDRVAGLELGCDDYIPKPFLVRELVIKVERLLKGSRPKPTEVRVGPYTVHLEKHLVSGREGEAIPLTVKEYDLLLHLAANQGLVLKRGEILNAVWGYTFYGSDRVVDDTIRRLRKKLPAIEIRTLYGLGYCLTEGDHESVFD